jgi:Flp pilus assembly protein TadD
VLRVSAILLLALLAFGASLWSPFFFDDYTLANDPAVTKPSGLAELLGPARTRPLTYASYWANYQAAGFEPFSYHFVNLALFLLIIWFAGEVFRKIADERAAWIALAIFALHPLQTEAVNYVFARATLLAALFCVLCWRSWLHGHRWRAAAWFAAAMLAKEEAAAFPLFLAGFEWFHERRRSDWKRLLAPLGAMFALVALFGIRLYYATTVTAGSGAGLDLGEITPWTYFLSQGRAIGLYLRLLVAPAGQTFDRDFPLTSSPDLESVMAWASVGAAAAGSLWLSRRWRPAWWIAGALILLAPTSSFAPLADLTAERRMFLPMLGFSLAAGAAIVRLAGRRAAALGSALALALAFASWHRTQVYASELSLWSDAAEKAPEKVRPKLQVARALEPQGAAAASDRKRLLDQARRLAPDDAEVLGEIGVFYLQTSSPSQAAAAFSEAIGRAPRDPQLRVNLGAALALLGRMAEAEVRFREALEMDGCNYDARNNLMLMLGQRGAADEARSFAEAPDGCRFSQEQLDALRAARGAR